MTKTSMPEIDASGEGGWTGGGGGVGGGGVHRVEQIGRASCRERVYVLV